MRVRKVCMCRPAALALCAGAAWLLGPSSAHAQPVLGQVDDFQTGTSENWNGALGFFTNVAGGQGGAGDFYLEVTANGGFGPGSPVATYNDNQWAGDYVAGGISGIQVDLANFGQIDLEMRAMLLFGLGGDWTTTVPLLVPADGQWHTVTFALTEADMTQIGGIGSFNDSLSSVGRLLLRHQSGAPQGPGGGSPIVGLLGIDNITAIAIPGPAVLPLLGVAALAVTRRRRRAPS